MLTEEDKGAINFKDSDARYERNEKGQLIHKISESGRVSIEGGSSMKDKEWSLEEDKDEAIDLIGNS